MQRHIFFISDGTGITAEQLGLSLMSQFEGDEFVYSTLPYIDTEDKADIALEQIAETFHTQGFKPIVFITLMNPSLRHIFDTAPAVTIDLFNAFIPTLEAALGRPASGKTGRTHGAHNSEQYHARIDAINYTLTTDDGLNTRHYDQADVVLVGVSRSGKTPTSIYLALHFGLKAANYPITQEDLDADTLPKALMQHAAKCFGLTINPERLAQIRDKRLEGSQYASIKQCATEVHEAEAMFKKLKIPFINTTALSVEEIATKIVAAKHLGRKLI